METNIQEDRGDFS